MPKFMISVASPVFPKMRFRYKGEEYVQRTIPQFSFPSIHLHGAHDDFKDSLTIHELFEPASNPKVIEFDAGHRFPRELPQEGFTELKTFVKDRFVAKNGSDADFDVDHQEYNFNVRLM